MSTHASVPPLASTRTALLLASPVVVAVLAFGWTQMSQRATDISPPPPPAPVIVIGVEVPPAQDGGIDPALFVGVHEYIDGVRYVLDASGNARVCDRRIWSRDVAATWKVVDGNVVVDFIEQTEPMTRTLHATHLLGGEVQR